MGKQAKIRRDRHLTPPAMGLLASLLTLMAVLWGMKVIGSRKERKLENRRRRYVQGILLMMPSLLDKSNWKGGTS